MVCLVLSAIVAAANPPALIKAPKGMVKLARDPATANMLNHMDRQQFVVEYRGYVHLSQGIVRYGRSVILAIGTRQAPSLADAAIYGQQLYSIISSKPRVRSLGSKSITLCRGQAGWLNAFVFPGDTFFQQVYALSGDLIYVATVIRPASVADPFNAEAAAKTLCPPQ